MYVLEVDLIIGDFYYERVDYNYLLKRIVKYIRDGNNSDLIYERFDEVMCNFMIGFIYVVLVGLCKQLVLYVEKLFFFYVVNFFKDNYYFVEVEYVEIIVLWYEVFDGCGFS